jgi:hypothetical protein
VDAKSTDAPAKAAAAAPPPSSELKVPLGAPREVLLEWGAGAPPALPMPRDELAEERSAMRRTPLLEAGSSGSALR